MMIELNIKLFWNLSSQSVVLPTYILYISVVCFVVRWCHVFVKHCFSFFPPPFLLLMSTPFISFLRRFFYISLRKKDLLSLLLYHLLDFLFLSLYSKWHLEVRLLFTSFCFVINAKWLMVAWWFNILFFYCISFSMFFFH